uniref:TNFAIP3 interacting protein 1 n=1 Tax=Branchiostoma belcheri tsingtauense TaxID=155462 RepID=S5DIK3_BRABE|nr:TNFAIP3 interacting protein 1 [Branchiostoma belcheri tsingtauense]
MDNDEEETVDGTTQEVEKLRQENERLRQENEACKSRLQGLQTLESSDQSKEETTTVPSESAREKKGSDENENVMVSLDETVNQTEGDDGNDQSIGGMMSTEQHSLTSEEEQPVPTNDLPTVVSGEPLSNHAQRLEAALQDDDGTRKSTEMAAEMARFGSRVLQMEKKYNIQSVLVRDLTAENEDLKKILAGGLQEKNDTIHTLQNQVDDLQAKLTAQEDQPGTTAVEITQPVYKENDEKQHSTDKEISELKKKVEELQRQKKEIIDVNKQWDVQYRSMKGSLEEKLEEAHRQVAEYRGQEDKRQRDIDKMLLSAKKRIDAEQEARERSVQDYQQEKQRGDTLSARVTILENQITDMMRQRGNLEAEIRRLNGALGEAPSMAIRTPPCQAAEHQQSAPRQSQPPSHNTQPSLDARTEIEVLRAQVATYREDFETERGDRERIQGEKETLRDEMVALRLQVDYLSQQLRVYEEDFNRERRQKERLQRELRRRPVGAEEPAPYSAGPRQEEYVQPPPVQFYPPPPPYREQPPHYQPYYRPTAAEIQQRELSRYPQRGRLTPRGTGYQAGRFAAQVIPRTLPTDVEHDCADGLMGRNVGDCPRCQRLFDNPRDLQDHIQRCIT